MGLLDFLQALQKFLQAPQNFSKALREKLVCFDNKVRAFTHDAVTLLQSTQILGKCAGKVLKCCMIFAKNIEL